MGVAAPSRQELGPGAVDEQDEARQETRVSWAKSPAGREVDVAALVGNAERRSGENRLWHGAREYPLSPRLRGASRCGFAFRSKGLVLLRGG